MFKKTAVLLSFFVFAAFPVIVLAQESEVVTTTATQTSEDITTPSTTPSSTTRPALMKTRELKTARTSLMEVENPKNEKTEKIDDEKKAKMMEIRTAFKEKMKEIKDTKKAAIIARLDGKINEINKKRTAKAAEHLDRLSSILGKISTKTAALKADGKNTAALETEIASATAAIEAAKVAATEQAAKDYVVDFVSETSLKKDAGTAIRQFIADMKIVYQKVKEAQEAVLKASKSIKALTEIDTTITPTSVPTE